MHEKRVRGGVPPEGEDTSTRLLRDTRPLDETDTAVAAVVAELTETAGEPVEYDWVIQRARREYGMTRPEVERTVECLVNEGVLRKVGADRLAVA